MQQRLHLLPILFSFSPALYPECLGVHTNMQGYTLVKKEHLHNSSPFAKQICPQKVGYLLPVLLL